MVGWELVAGYLAKWAMGKARRAAGHLDAGVDAAMEATMARLHDVISAKLGSDPAVAKLEADATQGVQDQGTHEQVGRAVAEAAKQDSAFAAELRQLLDRLERAGNAAAGPAAASADRGGVAVGGQVVHVTGPHRPGRSWLGVLLGAVLIGLLILIGVILIDDAGLRFYQRDTFAGSLAGEEEAYQKQVTATCDQIHDILIADHMGEVGWYQQDVPAYPVPPTSEVYRIRSTNLIRVMMEEVAAAKMVFNQFSRRTPPATVRVRKQAVDRAFAEWAANMTRTIRRAQTKVHDGMSLGELMRTLGWSIGPDGIDTEVSRDRLNSTMSNLAGRTCTI